MTNGMKDARRSQPIMAVIAIPVASYAWFPWRWEGWGTALGLLVIGSLAWVAITTLIAVFPPEDPTIGINVRLRMGGGWGVLGAFVAFVTFDPSSDAALAGWSSLWALLARSIFARWCRA